MNISLDKRKSTTQNLFLEPLILQKEEKINNYIFLPTNKERTGEGGLRTKGFYKKSIASKPLLSVITVVFNGEQFIEETIKSVLFQDYDNVEYIIIDGKSTDQTVSLIKKYESCIDYWVSEPDQGLYDAMNKGIYLSQGDIIGIINSDDFYEPNAFQKVVSIYQRWRYRVDEMIVITGSLYKVDESNDIKFIIKRDKTYLNKRIDWGMPLNHPSTFITRKLYRKVGAFSATFKICGDYDLIYRIFHFQSKVEFFFIDDVLATMRLNGISDKLTTVITRSWEHYLVRKKYKKKYINIYILTTWLLKTMSKSFLKNVVSAKIMKLYYKFFR